MRDLTFKPLNIYAKLGSGARGPLIATGYTRLVIGGRGAYLEIHESQFILSTLKYAPGEEYRYKTQPKDWTKIVYYGYLQTREGNRKVYHQFKKVNYADYLVGYYYISPTDIDYNGTLYSETSMKPLD